MPKLLHTIFPFLALFETTYNTSESRPPVFFTLRVRLYVFGIQILKMEIQPDKKWNELTFFQNYVSAKTCEVFKYARHASKKIGLYTLLCQEIYIERKKCSIHFNFKSKSFFFSVHFASQTKTPIALLSICIIWLLGKVLSLETQLP